MHTQKGTIWDAVPTELDALWCPTLEFAAGGAEANLALLMFGAAKPSNPTFDGVRYYLLRFSIVQFVGGYAEGMYHQLAEATPGAEATISEIVNSKLIEDLKSLCPADWGLKHFMIASGGMYCEVVASANFELEQFESYEAARAAASTEYRTLNFDLSSLSAREDALDA